ncbi:MAG: DUF3899 domain-containing protein [Acholeplasmatales bacterium]|jgi:ABC-type uncharacterized transport system permease subunit|nr:DUF3899 domain-containing protein [Acholeplasmatales bacterium]
MNEKQKPKISFIKCLIIAVIIPVIALGFQLIVYHDRFTLTNIVSSIFASSALVFVVGLVMLTGATRIWSGISYSTRMIFKRKETKEKYPTYKDYTDDRASENRKGNAYIVLIALAYLLVDLVLAIIDIN